MYTWRSWLQLQGTSRVEVLWWAPDCSGSEFTRGSKAWQLPDVHRVPGPSKSCKICSRNLLASLHPVLMLYRRAERALWSYQARWTHLCYCVKGSSIFQTSSFWPVSCPILTVSPASSEMVAWHFKLPGLFLKVFLFKVCHVRWCLSHERKMLFFLRQSFVFPRLASNFLRS